MIHPRRALVVDDEPGVVDAVVYRLSKCGFAREQVVVARNAFEAMQALGAGRFDIVLLDLRLPRDERDMSPSDEMGRQVLRQCTKAYPDLPVIMMTAYAGRTPAELTHTGPLLMKIGARDFIRKPFEEALESLEYKVLEHCGSAPQRAPAAAPSSAPAPRAGRTVLGISGLELKRRTEITVNGRIERLPNALFVRLLIVCEARLRGADVFVSIYEMGAKNDKDRGSSALRTTMEPFLQGATLLRGDGQSSYRLHEDIELGDVNCNVLAQHSEDRVRNLAAAITALLRDLVEAPERGSSTSVARSRASSEAVRLRFAYSYERRQCQLQFDGRDGDLSPAHYEMLAHLALARAGGGVGLVDKKVLGAKSSYGWNERSRLQKRLHALFGEAADGLIAPDGKNKFRLTLGPHEIQIDRASLAAHPCGRIREAFGSGER